MNASIEASGRVVCRNYAFEIHGEAGTFTEIIDVYCMKIVAVSRSPFCSSHSSNLILVSLRCEIQRIGIRINDSGGRHTDSGVYIHTSIQICSQEWDIQPPWQNNFALLCIEFVEVVLGFCDVNVLNAIRGRVNEGLGEDLLGVSVVFARKGSLEKLTRLGAAKNGWVQIMTSSVVRITLLRDKGSSRLVSRFRIISSPGNGIR